MESPWYTHAYRQADYETGPTWSGLSAPGMWNYSYRLEARERTYRDWRRGADCEDQWQRGDEEGRETRKTKMTNKSNGKRQRRFCLILCDQDYLLISC